MADNNSQRANSDAIRALINVTNWYVQFARTQRQNQNFTIAGNYYVAVGHGHLMGFRRLPENITDEDASPPSVSMAQFGYGMKYMLAGVLCYRLGDLPHRSRNLCNRASLLLSDIREEEYTARPKIGLCYEIEADFMTVANMSGSEAAYENAVHYYEDTDSDLGWQMEDAFDDFTLLVEELADSVGYEIDDEARERFRRLSLRDRIEYKREHFPDIIDRVIEVGNWESDLF